MLENNEPCAKEDMVMTECRRMQLCIISKFISVELADTVILCILGVDKNILFIWRRGNHHVAATSLKLALLHWCCLSV